MSILFNKPVEHAIKALIYLAVCENHRLVTCEEISEVEQISSNHLSKILKVLTQKKVLRSFRGPHGGFMLSRDPCEITLWDLLNFLGGQERFSECAIGWTECNDEAPCPLHEVWASLRGRNKQYLESTTLSDLAVAAIEKQREKYPQFYAI
jgi:Rrf2 family protein